MESDGEETAITAVGVAVGVVEVAGGTVEGVVDLLDWCEGGSVSGPRLDRRV